MSRQAPFPQPPLRPPTPLPRYIVVVVVALLLLMAFALVSTMREVRARERTTAPARRAP